MAYGQNTPSCDPLMSNHGASWVNYIDKFQKSTDVLSVICVTYVQKDF